MTRSSAGWRKVMARFEANAQHCDRLAKNYDDVGAGLVAKEDVLVGDVYHEAATRARADAAWWRDRAAIAEGWAADADLPVTLTVAS